MLYFSIVRGYCLTYESIKQGDERMNKILRIGTMQIGGRRGSIYCKIELVDGMFSISGVIAPLPSGNSLGGCGQIDMEFAHRNMEDNDNRYSNLIYPEDIKFAEGWNKELWLDFLDIWKKYHLNDMKAGTPKQEKAIDEFRAKNKIEGWAYEKEVEYLKSIKLYNDRGVKYGFQWLKEDLPFALFAYINRLPETDKTPAWC